MSKIVKKSKNVNSVPFDCWTNIIEYMKSGKDLLSLYLTIKGLYEYVKNISPRITKNTVFTITNLPTRKIKNVANVLISKSGSVDSKKWNRRSEHRAVYLLEDLNSPNFSVVIDRVLLFFPNLHRFELSLEVPRGLEPEKKIEKLPRVCLSRKDFSHQNLVELDLFLQMSFSLTQFFPRVEILSLGRVNFREDEDFDQNGNDLEVDWKCLPLLRTLQLENWSVNSSSANFNLRGIKDRIQKLVLIDIDGLSSTDLSLNEFKKLKEVLIGDQEFVNMNLCETIRDLPELERLNLSFQSGPKMVLKEIKNLPKLKEFYMDEPFVDLQTISNLPLITRLDLYVGPDFRSLDLKNIGKLSMSFEYEQRRIHPDFKGFSNLPLLHSLRLNFDDLDPDDSHTFQISNLFRLKDLRITGSHLRTTIEKTPQLRTLKFSKRFPEIMDIKTIESLDTVIGKEVEYFDDVVISKFIQNLRDIKSLVITEKKSERNWNQQIIVISLIDLPFLKTAELTGNGEGTRIRLSSVKKCSELETLSFTPSFDFYLSELPSLNNLKVNGFLQECQEHLLFHEIQNIKSLRSLSFSIRQEKETRWGWGSRKINLGKLSFLKTLRIRFQGVTNINVIPGSEDNLLERIIYIGDGSIHVRDFPKLKKVVCVYKKETNSESDYGSVRHDFTKCVDLKVVKVVVPETERKSGESSVRVWLSVSDLPSLMSLIATGVHTINTRKIPDMNFSKNGDTIRLQRKETKKMFDKEISTE